MIPIEKCYEEAPVEADAVTGSTSRMCTRTVMDTSDPDITFDADGVSNHWYEYRRLWHERVVPPDRAEDALQRIVRRIRDAGRGKRYDCILGLSGGVDSSYLAHRAVEQGLRPLAVHFDNGWNTEAAVSNIQGLIAGLGLDLFTFVMDWPEFRDLQRAYFNASVIDLEVPTDHMIFGALYQIAAKQRISYILSGNNIATEAILPRAWYYPKFDLVNLREIHRRYGTLPLRRLPAFGWQKMAYYTGLLGIEDVKLLDIGYYDKATAKKLLMDKYHWREYGPKHHESIFTRFYQGYILPRKFGIDKRKAHLSNLICSGQMTRDGALAELAKPPYEQQQQADDKRYVAKKLGYTDEEFEQLLCLPNRAHEEFGTDARWRARYFRVLRLAKPVTALARRLNWRQ